MRAPPEESHRAAARAVRTAPSVAHIANREGASITAVASERIPGRTDNPGGGSLWPGPSGQSSGRSPDTRDRPLGPERYDVGHWGNPRGFFATVTVMSGWPAVSYEQWNETCDTLHAHCQVLGKLAVRLAPPERQLQHAALRLTARGWETVPLPAPDGSGSLVVVVDLHAHETVIEHSNGRVERVALTPNRAVGVVTREVLTAVGRLGGPVEIDPTPQEVPWNEPLDEDRRHAALRRTTSC